MTPSSCILCNRIESVYLFERGDSRIVRCKGCDLLRREPPLSFRGAGEMPESRTRTEELAAQHYIRCLKDQGLQSGQVLYSGLNDRDVFSQMLQQEGYQVTFLDDLNSPSTARVLQRQYDCIILYQTLERSPEVFELLLRVRRCLKDNGLFMAIVVSLDSFSARTFGRRWIGWNAGLNHFFSRATAQLLLEKAGFHQILQLDDARFYTLDHVGRQINRLPNQSLRSILQPVLAIVPNSLKKKELCILSSAKVVMARTTVMPERQKLSIIMPVYNEKRTFMESFEKIHNRVLTGISGVDDAEIIIVESNSTDGSRELVQTIQSEKVKVVLEDKPQGKGHAVRTGLKHATGEICIIQDADLEYDVNDYDALVLPLVEYRRTFVLGTRHAGDWKIRKFEGEALSALFLNFGHILFTTIINVFFGQNLTDPFTMYKVFRRECLYMLKFECNRFDFDHELLIKLVQKGFHPLEIPVNYSARGFAEGKKVSVIRDPITWVIADVKYFFASPFEDSYKHIGSMPKKAVKRGN